MFCEWCIYKLLEQNDQCPICRCRIIDYTYCSNAGNIINRMIERMPYEVKMKFNKLKASRDEDKPKSNFTINLNNVFQPYILHASIMMVIIFPLTVILYMIFRFLTFLYITINNYYNTIQSNFCLHFSIKLV